jgi:hypothetical protein
MPNEAQMTKCQTIYYNLTFGFLLLTDNLHYFSRNQPTELFKESNFVLNFSRFAIFKFAHLTFI